MFDKFRNNLDFERDNSFVIKVLLLCFPSVVVFMILALYRQVDPLIAVASLAGVALFNTILLFPLSLELQKIRRYVAKLSSGEDVEADIMDMSEQETKDLINAINNMHKFWSEKNYVIKTKSLSDAAVLDSLPDPLIVIDNTGDIIGANLSARQVFGEKIMHKNVDSIFDSHSFINAVTKVLKKNRRQKIWFFMQINPFQLNCMLT